MQRQTKDVEQMFDDVLIPAAVYDEVAGSGPRRRAGDCPCQMARPQADLWTTPPRFAQWTSENPGRMRVTVCETRKSAVSLDISPSPPYN